ncbi:MAG: GNAT family N-acetyltransferase [Alphaproteobacteria bacterium]|nr:GNAT family N-acetyltransferase [Alphaproteobacteria bacterium]
MSLSIREARLPADKPVILDFILGLQRFEAAFEPNRRLDDAYVEDQFAALAAKFARGKIFIAEAGGAPVGWAVVHEEAGESYECAEERRFAYIRELYVSEAARGLGAGRALIAACEGWARSRGFSTIRIGHLAENGRAEAVYARAGYAPYVVQRRKNL